MWTEVDGCMAVERLHIWTGDIGLEVTMNGSWRATDLQLVGWMTACCCLGYSMTQDRRRFGHMHGRPRKLEERDPRTDEWSLQVHDGLGMRREVFLV